MYAEARRPLRRSRIQDPERQLHRHMLYPTQPGGMVMIDARGDLSSGIFGEMMLTFFAGRGGDRRGDRRLHPRFG